MQICSQSCFPYCSHKLLLGVIIALVVDVVVRVVVNVVVDVVGFEGTFQKFSESFTVKLKQYIWNFACMTGTLVSTDSMQHDK